MTLAYSTDKTDVAHLIARFRLTTNTPQIGKAHPFGHPPQMGLRRGHCRSLHAGYVKKPYSDLPIPLPSKPQHAPQQMDRANYGAKQQFADHDPDSPALSTEASSASGSRYHLPCHRSHHARSTWQSRSQAEATGSWTLSPFCSTTAPHPDAVLPTPVA
jgi:hypothetical protein